ncbi:MAG: hypothetical protein L0215_10745, partial [Gemmataceae bacterium]|nr:hypothetical protein [Gemmataceae bacterium]
SHSWNDFDGRTIGKPIDAEVLIQCEHAPCSKLFRKCHQGGICQVHGQVVILRHHCGLQGPLSDQCR